MKLLKFVIASTLVLTVYTSPAYAEFSYQLIAPPGALFTQTLGINNAGIVTGRADDGVTSFSFTYDMKSGEYTEISNEFVVFEISNSGVMVGSVDNFCAIRDKNGNVTTFFPPPYAPDSVCRARGVNPDGKVSGFVADGDGVWLGFIYDSEYGTFEEFLPSPQTIAQGIDAQGQNVGSVFLFPDEAYPGSPPGRYAYLRQTDESVKYFAINESFPGRSRARGLSENGLISGFYEDPDTFDFRSYVTTLSQGNEFETITLMDHEIVFQSPCDPDLPPLPGEGYELFTRMFAAQVRNDGVVVGSCTDYHFNRTTGDLIVYTTYGFIATPTGKINMGGGNCLPPPAGMTNWWPGDGNSIDVLGGLDGEFIDDATTGPGLVDMAFALDGDGDFINVADDPALDFGTDDFTVDLWASFNDTFGEQVLIEKWVQGDGFIDGWTLTKLPDNVLRLAFDREDGEEADLDSNVLPILPGNWYHFAATREGNTFTLFMDGEVIAQDDFEGDMDLDSESSLKFGHRGNPEDTPGSIDTRDFYLNGRIDEVELFGGTALSEEQVMDLFAAGHDGKCKRGF
jgi:hypothetical protein